MKNLFISGLITIALLSTSCVEKAKVDTSKAPQEVVAAIESSFQLSKELTDLQINAGIDNLLDEAEIDSIGEVFKALVILNNDIKEKYEKDIYFLALSKERKGDFDKLAESVVFLKNCQGYDELGLKIQNISMQFNNGME